MSASIKKTLRVAVPVELAFVAFTEHVDAWWPPGHRKFEASTLQFEAWVGGRFFETAGSGDHALLGEVLRWEPPRRLTYSWWPGAGAGPTEVDVQFVSEGDSTLIEVTHSEADSGIGADWPKRVQRFLRGWDSVLASFAEHCVTHPGGKSNERVPS